MILDAIIILGLLAVLVFQFQSWRLRNIQFKYLKLVVDLHQEDAKVLSTKLEELEKNVLVAGKVLAFIEQETQILQKRRETVEQIKQRFPARTNPR